MPRRCSLDIDVPRHRDFSAQEQLSGTGWHQGTAGSCTLLPPGGTRKGCQSKN